VSNRYFLLSYTLLLPAFVHAASAFGKKVALVITTCFAFVLFCGNGITYDNRYGNAWDCSLKSFSYFKLKSELDSYIAAERIERRDVEAGFQVYFNDRYCLMSERDQEYNLLSDTEMPVGKYVVDSDICNNFNSAREEFLAQHYTLKKEFKKGAVYLRLYQKE
jgi:hypothetical protein